MKDKNIRTQRLKEIFSLKKTKLSIPEKIIDLICEKLVRKKIKNQFGGNLQAFVSGGKVTGVRILNKGKGYTSTPTVNLVGGNGASTYNAVAVAYLGEGTTRSFELKVKF